MMSTTVGGHDGRARTTRRRSARRATAEGVSATGDDGRRLDDQHVCYLETVGRVSGRTHVVEIWYAAADRTLYLLSGGRERADWVRNLIAQPRVRVRIGSTTYAATAEVLAGGPEEARARELLAAKYYGWRSGPLPNEWARRALPAAVRLADTPAGMADGR